MRTSLNEIKQIEDYLFNTAAVEDSLLFEAKTILDQQLQDKVRWQQKTYQVIQLYGRKTLKAELEAVHQQLFNEPQHVGFAQRIKQLFNNRH